MRPGTAPIEINEVFTNLTKGFCSTAFCTLWRALCSKSGSRVETTEGKYARE